MESLISVPQALTIGMIFSRLIGFFIGFPVINTQFVPLNVRIMLVISLSFFTIYFLDIKYPDIEDFSITFIFLLVLKEFLIGFFIGVLTQIFIGAFSYAAELISFFMGLTLVNTFDPTFGQISVIDRYFILLFYLLFFVSGAYLLFIAGLIKSFEIIPIYELSINTGVFQYILKKSTQLFILAFKMAFPFLLVLFILNVALALINRLIPQVNVFIVGLPMQIFIGLLALSIGSSAVILFSSHILNIFIDSYLSTIKILGR